MVNVTFNWEARKRADHKRSYDIARKRFLAGDMQRGWKPKHPGYNFESFELYETDLHLRVENIVSEELIKIDPLVEEVQTHIYGTGEYNNLATYYKTSRNGKKVDIGLNFDTLALKYVDKESEGEIRETLRHEFWHHVDRDILERRGLILRTASIGIEKSDGRVTRMTDDEARIETLRYIALCRIEGFTKRYEKDSSHNVRDLVFLSNTDKILRDHTDIATKGLEHLSTPVPRVNYGEYEYRGSIQRGYRTIQDKEHMKWMDKFWNNKFKEGFSPYDQGANMFNLITVAETKRAIGKVEMIPLEQREVFEKTVREKILGLKKFEDFYNFYYTCVEELGLSEDRSIIRPRFAEKLIASEKNAATDVFDLISKQIVKIKK